MRAAIAGSARGARWLPEGWRLFRGAPLTWFALVIVYWLLMMVVSMFPILGAVAAPMLVPGLSVGFMAAARAVERGQQPELGLLFEGFRVSAHAQVALGALYLAGLIAVIAATALVDEGAMARRVLSGQGIDAQFMDAHATSVFVAMLVYAPLMMMFWFAPPLAAWHGTPVLKALFFSLAAFLMNWRAFLAYGAVTGLVLFVVPFIVVSALTLLTGGGQPGSAMAVGLPLIILLLPTLFASFYASYRDVFGGERA